MIDIQKFPKFEQRQDALFDQLADLRQIANRIGCYDAADAIGQWCDNLPQLRYGCHCDLEPHMTPDGCVIDDNERYNCIYAKHIDRKEQCEYWRIVK